MTKFCKATKEVFFIFPALPLVYLQALKSVVAGWEYKSNELSSGKEDGVGIYGLTLYQPPISLLCSEAHTLPDSSGMY